MSHYTATVRWQRQDEPFTDNKYSRKHNWHFDGGVTVPASASPQEVPAPYSDPNAVDPEEAFVASISSCHMLWFLSLAARNGFIVESNEDEAEGFMGKDSEGHLSITRVILRPNIIFNRTKKPDQQKFDNLHHQAHNKCFIAHSVKTEITVDANFEVH